MWSCKSSLAIQNAYGECSQTRPQFYVDVLQGAARLRGSLGTRSQDAARRLTHKLETALSEGSSSALWPELRSSLPRATLQSSLREFEIFLSEKQITLLIDITKPLVEKSKAWRVERIKKRKFSRGATGLALDAAILHRVFAHALQAEMIEKNPVRMEGRPGENPQGGAEPFTSNGLSRLRDQATDDLLAFLASVDRLARLRAVTLTWREVYFDRKEIERVTQKRRKKVILPIHSELLFVFGAEFERRRPQPPDRVLINPATRKPLTRPRLYHRMLVSPRKTRRCGRCKPTPIQRHASGGHANAERESVRSRQAAG
jgi:hypothetical protein